MLEISGLKVRYRVKGKESLALDGINIGLEAGDICVIVGPSGCGKSTLLKTLSGIMKTYEGNISIDGESIDPKVQTIGFIPQNYGLLNWKTVKENILLSLKVKRKLISGSEKIYIDLLRKLGLEGLENRYPSQLSGGQRQRVAIARSFILDPDLLLMDEPFSALDAITREEIQDVFLNLWNEKKTTTILVTHSVEEAVYLGRKIVILSSLPGRIIKVIDNPLFMQENLRFREEYYDMSMYLRRIIKEGWSS